MTGIDDKTRTTIDLIRQRYSSTIEEIRADNSRTEDYKRSEMAREFITARRRINDLAAKSTAEATNRRRSLESQVFGIGALSGDAGSLAISRRDASDRVAQLKDEAAALDLLVRADRSGDEPLAQALAERAVVDDWADVANAFVETRPHLKSALSEIWNTKKPGIVSEMAEAQATLILKPHELSTIPDHQLEILADPYSEQADLGSQQFVTALEAHFADVQGVE